MALTDDQKKNLLIGGGVGALALVVGFVFGGKAAAAPAPDQSLQRGQSPRFQPPQRVPTRDHDRKRKKRRPDDGGERGERGVRGERGENGRGEYGRKKHRRRHRGD